MLSKIWSIAIGILVMVLPSHVFGEKTGFGNHLLSLDPVVAHALSLKDIPNKEGAIGRNKKDYFHVRFQLGMHHQIYAALIDKDVQRINRFLDAVAYSFQHQLETGDFSYQLPLRLRIFGAPNESDLASGVSFFTSSLGTGWIALQSSSWVQESVECAGIRQQMQQSQSKFVRLIDSLKQQQETLLRIDKRAPNRMLFNAVAFYTMGKILNDQHAIEVAENFINIAITQSHPDGYFIEGDGFDSSYNGVSCALSVRLLLMGYEDETFNAIALKAIEWQQSRILENGKIQTEGNSRVAGGAKEEAFLGRKKDVDAGHTIEAFALASLYFEQKSYSLIAKQILKHYTSKN